MLSASTATDIGCKVKAVTRSSMSLLVTSLNEPHGTDRSRAHTLGSSATVAVIGEHGVLLGLQRLRVLGSDGRLPSSARCSQTLSWTLTLKLCCGRPAGAHS